MQTKVIYDRKEKQIIKMIKKGKYYKSTTYPLVASGTIDSEYSFKVINYANKPYRIIYLSTCDDIINYFNRNNFIPDPDCTFKKYNEEVLHQWRNYPVIKNQVTGDVYRVKAIHDCSNTYEYGCRSLDLINLKTGKIEEHMVMNENIRIMTDTEILQEMYEDFMLSKIKTKRNN